LLNGPPPDVAGDKETEKILLLLGRMCYWRGRGIWRKRLLHDRLSRWWRTWSAWSVGRELLLGSTLLNISDRTLKCYGFATDNGTFVRVLKIGVLHGGRTRCSREREEIYWSRHVYCQRPSAPSLKNRMHVIMSNPALLLSNYSIPRA